LAGIVLAAVNGNSASSRDARRAAEVKELKGALELYFQNNGQYPSVGTDNIAYAVTLLQSSVVPAYLPKVPQDPQYAGVVATQGDYQYIRGSAGSYGIWVYLEKSIGSVPAGRCMSGVNLNAGWWSNSVVCPF